MFLRWKMQLDSVQTVPLKSDHLGCGVASCAVSKIPLGSVLDLSVNASLHECKNGLKMVMRFIAWVESTPINGCYNGSLDEHLHIIHLTSVAVLCWCNFGCHIESFISLSTAAEENGTSEDQLIQLHISDHAAGFCWLLGRWVAEGHPGAFCLCFLPVVTLTASVDCCCPPPLLDPSPKYTTVKLQHTN